MNFSSTMLSAALGAVLAVSATFAAAQTTLRIFTGGQQRPDVMRKIVDEYQKRAPNVKVDIEVGGATSEAQQQYLNTVLASKDPTLSSWPDRLAAWLMGRGLLEKK